MVYGTESDQKETLPPPLPSKRGPLFGSTVRKCMLNCFAGRYLRTCIYLLRLLHYFVILGWMDPYVSSVKALGKIFREPGGEGGESVAPIILLSPLSLHAPPSSVSSCSKFHAPSEQKADCFLPRCSRHSSRCWWQPSCPQPWARYRGPTRRRPNWLLWQQHYQVVE